MADQDFKIKNGLQVGNGTLVINSAGDWVGNTIPVSEGGTGVTTSTGTGSVVLSASPTFTGTPLAPTAAADTNTTQIATTAFVLGQASSTTPAMNGVAATGTSLKYARADHVHATDTSRAPLASPTFTGTVTLPGDPSSALQAATKQYVDNLVQGLDIKPSVKFASTGNLALSGTSAIDGPTLVAGDRVLVKNQTTAGQNGIYVVAAGAWTLATDIASSSLGEGAFVWVEQGTTNGDTGWVLVDASAKTWTQFTGVGQITAGAGLTKTAPNQIDVVGTADRITVNADNIDIASTYAGQNTITTLGTVATGTWNATTIATNKGGTGLTSFTANGIVYASSTSALTTTAGTAAQILLANASNVPTWTSVTGDVTVSNTGVTAIGASKVTNTMLAGSIASSKLVGTDIATVGTITSGTWNGSVVGLTYGGTGAALTAANGGVVYSGASALAVTAAGTSGQLLVSAGAAAPVWTSTTTMSPTFLSTTLTAQYADASSVQRQLTFNRQTSGTAANGIGTGIAFIVEDAAGGAAARSYIDTVLDDVTSGSVDASLVFSTARNNVLTEDMRVGYNGNVGIGTATPSKKLDVVGDAQVSGAFTVDTNTLVVDATNNRVGISTAAPAAKLHITNNAASDTLTTTGGNIKFADNPGVAANGELYFWGGVNTSDRGYFGYWDYDLAPGGASSFFFTPAGKGYLRQGLLLNYLAPVSNEVIIKQGSDWAVAGEYWYFNNSGVFGRTSGAVGVWSIDGTGGTTGISDIRLKSDIAPISYGLTQLKALTPISYVFTSDAAATKQLGFSAQEVKEVIPEAVSELHGELPDGSSPLGMSYTTLIPVLVKAVQELSAQVDELKAKMAAHGIE